MVLKKAVPPEFERIAAFYRYVTENTENMRTYGRWEYGKHPTDELIRDYILGGYMYYAERDGQISAAVAVAPFQEKDYHSLKWSCDLKDDEVSVVHLLCVDPKEQRRGLARDVMLEVIETAEKCGKRAVRLDALCCNKPAHSLYEALGFRRCDVQNWFTCNAGWIDFYLFEYVL